MLHLSYTDLYMYFDLQNLKNVSVFSGPSCEINL